MGHLQLGGATSWFAALAFMAGSFSCATDPVRERQIAALGGEIQGVQPGPLHRPGQPCGLCHAEGGLGVGEFSLSGTVYRTPSALTPLPGVTLRFIDSSGEQRAASSNCAGNFFVRKSDWSPSWPVWLKMQYSDVAHPDDLPLIVEMTSAIFRERSCGSCHADPAGPSTIGHVYFAEDGATLPETPCR